jgi:hypothetical protein
MNEVKRPSLREAARRGAEANRQARQTAPPPEPTPAVAVAEPKAKPAEVVKASCGHEIDVGPCKPAFLAERVKQLAGLPCPDCKRKAQQEREAAEQEAARKRREEMEPRPAKPRPRLYGRLPHGANFNVTWDAEAGKWTGTLTVPQGGIYNGSVTAGEDSAVFALLMQLDRAYRHMPPGEGASNIGGVPTTQPQGASNVAEQAR